MAGNQYHTTKVNTNKKKMKKLAFQCHRRQHVRARIFA